MAAAVIQHRYAARLPFEPFHARTQRFGLLVCHRRAGKTVAVVNDMVIRALRTPKPNALYAYIAPTYGQAKNIAWTYIKSAVKDIPGTKLSESECSVLLPNGSKIRCFGVDNPDALRGLYFDGVVCDEFGEWEGRAYTEVIRPAVADRQGWVVFIGTPKGPSNKFAKLREHAMNSGGKWFYLELKASESGLLPQSELDELRADMDPEEYEQELECSFAAANRGSYYGKHIAELERRGQLRPQDLYDNREKVSLAMDIGTRDATAIWFWQAVNGEVRFIDYWEETGWDAEEVCEMLEMKPYTYETWWLPHDAKHKTFRSKKSVIDLLREFSAAARIVPNPDAGNRVIHGVNAVRKVLRTYPLAFDSKRCARGIEALRNYSRKWNNDAQVLAEKATHDQWSHGADAFRYACLSITPSDIDLSIERHRLRADPRAESITVGSVNTNTRWTLNDAFAERARQQRAQGDRFRMRIG